MTVTGTQVPRGVRVLTYELLRQHSGTNNNGDGWRCSCGRNGRSTNFAAHLAEVLDDHNLLVAEPPRTAKAEELARRLARFDGVSDEAWLRMDGKSPLAQPWTGQRAVYLTRARAVLDDLREP